MAIRPDYISGEITLVSGSADFTTTGAALQMAAVQAGDSIIAPTGHVLIIASITGQNSGTLFLPCPPDAAGVDLPLRIRFQPDGSRYQGAVRDLVEKLANGNLDAFAGLVGSPDEIPIFTGPGAMDTINKSELVNGVQFDVAVDDLTGRDAYDSEDEGFKVLVADMGDGRSALFYKRSGDDGDWSDPAYVTGPVGPLAEITVGTTTTGAPGTDAEVENSGTPTAPVLDFTIPAGKGFQNQGEYSASEEYAEGDVVRSSGSSWIAKQATTGNPPPVLPVEENDYWSLLAKMGDGGDMYKSTYDPTNRSEDVFALIDGKVGVDEQTLTDAQKAQARENIGLELASGLRLVAFPTRVPTYILATAQIANARQALIASDNIDALRLVYGAWVVGSLTNSAPYVETATDPITIAASVEYPEGVFHQVKFGGATSRLIASGDTAESDELAVHIPEGAQFWVRTWQDAGSGSIIYSQYINALHESQVAFESGVSGDFTDKTMGGTIEAQSIISSIGPIAVIGRTKKSAICILGDSRSVGQGDVMDNTLATGNVARSLGAGVAYAHLGRAGEKVADLATSNSRRVALAQAYCSDVILAEGINDINGGATADDVKGNVETVVSEFGALPVYVCTIEPRTTSTDNWSTLENQTLSANNAERVTHNDRVRAGSIVGAAGYFDLADAVESSRNSGLWRVNGSAFGFTGDGLHQSPNGYRVQALQLPVSVDRIIRPLPAPAIKRGELSGIFTATARGETTAGSCTYLARSGRYQKVGSLVFYQCTVRWTGHTGVGNLVVDFDIPFDNIYLLGPTPGNSTFTALPYTTGRQVIVAIDQVRKPSMRFFEQGPNLNAMRIQISPASNFYGLSGFYFTEQ